MQSQASIDASPITILPHLSRLFVDFLAQGRASSALLHEFYPMRKATSEQMSVSAAKVADRAAMADRLLAQNRSLGAGEAALQNIERLRRGASAVVTGQQVGLFGGPLLVLYKAATAIVQARAMGAVPVFWLASEDHDLDEVDHAVLGSRRRLETLRLALSGRGRPVGGLQLGEGVTPLLAEVARLLGDSTELDWLREAYQPEATLAEAFGRWMARVFREQGLVVIDASTREWHKAGAATLRQAIECAYELEGLLAGRNRRLVEQGYHAQVLVSPSSSLLFLLEEQTGYRLPLRRQAEAGAMAWQAGKRSYSTADLLAILDAEPERLSPNALLRPVFEDTILPTAAYVGGPAEVAYFAQTQVVYQALLGRTTPVLPRMSATLIPAPIAEVMERHGLSLEDLLHSSEDALLHRIAARAMPIEGKRKLAQAGRALDHELAELLPWIESRNPDLGRAARTSASKMLYQMNRLRRLAANFEIQKEQSLARHMHAMATTLVPQGHPQERVVAGVSYLAAYGQSIIDYALAAADRAQSEAAPEHYAIHL